MRIKQFNVQFKEYIPEKLQEGVLYISMEYATASHKCACGCGQEVVTPFTPTDWKLTFDGESVSLSPSIGNWSYLCRSHYFIQKNRIVWAQGMSQKAIASGRILDRVHKANHYEQNDATGVELNSSARQSQDTKSKSMIDKFLDILARFFGFKSAG
ncbi:DUF6527 family protein [Desulfobacula toluolica]|uniref:DUF6527 family protein n=1 Tax=Desulfobacula toluolica TaxID=28223 RepID=UPI00059E219E|nr:DUF6527 family protein [Desulfobacula toluolica]